MVNSKQNDYVGLKKYIFKWFMFQGPLQNSIHLLDGLNLTLNLVLHISDTSIF